MGDSESLSYLNMYDHELQKIIQELRNMEGRFEKPTTAAAPHLNSSDRAAFKRLMLETISLLNSALGALNAFAVPLFGMTNILGYGGSNSPSLSLLHEAIGLEEGGLNQLRRKNSIPARQPWTAFKPTYVDQSRILEIQSINTSLWDLKRLVRLLQELNTAHSNEMYMTTAMLVRAVSDHVPPIFNVKRFTEVANNYPANRSFSDQMNRLDGSLRKICRHIPSFSGAKSRRLAQRHPSRFSGCVGRDAFRDRPPAAIDRGKHIAARRSLEFRRTDYLSINELYP